MPPLRPKPARTHSVCRSGRGGRVLRPPPLPGVRRRPRRQPPSPGLRIRDVRQLSAGPERSGMSLERGTATRPILWRVARYRTSDARAWSQVVQWRIRARVTDGPTGDCIEFSRRSMAQEVAELLNRATRGERPVEPRDATPFPAYDVSHGHDGWVYIWCGDGALSHKAVGRSRSEELARRAAELLSLANARPRRGWRGPIKSYFSSIRRGVDAGAVRSR